jgi:hypothetical protein
MLGQVKKKKRKKEKEKRRRCDPEERKLHFCRNVW